MRMGVRGLLVVAMCAAVGIVARRPRAPATMPSCSSSSPPCSTRRRASTKRVRRSASPPTPTIPALKLRARIGVVKTALLVGEFEEAQREAASLRDDSPQQSRSDGHPRRRAVVGGPVRRIGARVPRRAGRRARDVARPARAGQGAGLALEARRGAGRGAGGAAHRRPATASCITPPAASSSGCAATTRRRRPTPTTSTCCPTRTAATRRCGRRRRSASCRRSRIARPTPSTPTRAGRLHTVDFKLVQDKVIVKGRVNGGRWVDFVLDTGSEQTTISRQVAQSGGVAPITYTLSAGVGEVGLRGLQLARLDTFEVGTLKVHDVPVLIKNPALRGIPQARDGELLADGARAVDDHRLRDPQADHRRVAARRAGRHPAADADAPAGDGARADQRRAPGLLRRRHRRRGDLDQQGHRRRAAARAGRWAGASR